MGPRKRRKTGKRSHILGQKSNQYKLLVDERHSSTGGGGGGRGVGPISPSESGKRGVIATFIFKNFRPNVSWGDQIHFSRGNKGGGEGSPQKKNLRHRQGFEQKGEGKDCFQHGDERGGKRISQFPQVFSSKPSASGGGGGKRGGKKSGASLRTEGKGNSQSLLGGGRNAFPLPT